MTGFEPIKTRHKPGNRRPTELKTHFRSRKVAARSRRSDLVEVKGLERIKTRHKPGNRRTTATKIHFRSRKVAARSRRSDMWR